MKIFMLVAHLLPLGLGAAPLEFTGWLVHWDKGVSLAAFEKNAALIQRVAPGWYDCGPDGMPRRLGQDIVKDWEKDRIRAIAKKHGVKIFALTANFDAGIGDFDRVRVSKFLNDRKLMARHAASLVQMAKEDGADGIDLDYESLKAADRDKFSEFVELTSKLARQRGLLTAIALHPKTEEPGNWDGTQAQDWKRLGKAVDLFRPMAYDNHWPTSEAGSIAPPDWARSILAFAVSQVDKSKVELGIPNYGYDWVGKKGQGIGWAEFQKLIKEKKAVPKRDKASGELTFKYENHEVWYADSEASLSKFPLAREFGIRGLALWRLGAEDPLFWERLKKNR